MFYVLINCESSYFKKDLYIQCQCLNKFYELTKFSFLNSNSEEPCTSGTTPVVSHCPAVSGEPSESSALSAMQNYNSESSSSSGTETIVAQVHQCH